MSTPPRKYRWLTEGETYRYQARHGLDERRGTHCVAVTLPRPGAKPANVLVRFLADGYMAVVSAGVLKKVGHEPLEVKATPRAAPKMPRLD